LGEEGTIPNVMFSGALLAIDRDWISNAYVAATYFESDYAQGLFGGLQELQASLLSTLSCGIAMPEVEEELKVVGDLIDFFNQTGHLNSTDVRQASLAYLKGASLCWILKLEAARAKTASPRAKTAYDKKICEIVRHFWLTAPYNRVELPVAVYDYVAQRNHPAPSSSPHRSPVDLEPMLQKLDPRLKDRRRGAWVALRSENPDRVSQAANSMVEVLDQVIDRVRGGKEFKDYLADRFPEQAAVVIASRKWITEVKNGLQAVKHHPVEQSPALAEDLFHQAEWIVSLLLRHR
jgi:hypothetical protein